MKEYGSLEDLLEFLKGITPKTEDKENVVPLSARKKESPTKKAATDSPDFKSIMRKNAETKRREAEERRKHNQKLSRELGLNKKDRR